MRKRILVLLFLSIFLVSCRSPQQRPIGENNLETNESSIFRTAPVEHCRITADTSEVRGGVGFDFDTIATLNRDDVVRVLDQVGDWYVVQLDNNQIGSIDINTAEPIVRETEEPHLPLDRDPQPLPDEAEITPPADGPEEEIPYPDRFRRPTLPEGEPQPGIEEGQRPPQVDRQPAGENRPQAQAGNLRNQEDRMVQLINQERERNGLPILQVDTEVARVAGIKSQDMVDHNYFSHYSPTYGSPFEMLDSFGINYLHAGENLAGNNSVDNAHTALMNSSGHRQNILNPNFTHVGIGVRTSPRYGFIYTQMFISKPR